MGAVGVLLSEILWPPRDFSTLSLTIDICKDSEFLARYHTEESREERRGKIWARNVGGTTGRDKMRRDSVFLVDMLSCTCPPKQKRIFHESMLLAEVLMKWWDLSWQSGRTE